MTDCAPLGDMPCATSRNARVMTFGAMVSSPESCQSGECPFAIPTCTAGHSGSGLYDSRCARISWICSDGMQYQA